MAETFFDFPKLPYDVRALIYAKLSNIEIRTLCTLSKHHYQLFEDKYDLFGIWWIGFSNKAVDIKFHSQVLCSPRRRGYLQTLNIDWSFVDSFNLSRSISALTHAVMKLQNLNNLLLDMTRFDYTSGNCPSRGFAMRPRVSTSYNIQSSTAVYAQANDFLIPSATIDVLVLHLRTTSDIAPNLLPYQEFVDRYPNIKYLTIYCINSNDEMDQLMESYLMTLPLDKLTISYCWTKSTEYKKTFVKGDVVGLRQV